MATSTEVRTMPRRSVAPPGLVADRIPSGTPMSSATKIPARASSRVAGSRSVMTSKTGRLSWNDVPKSSVSRPAR